MKIYSLLIFIFLIQISWGQVGIGVPNPTESLEVNGSIKMVDGTQGTGKVMVSDANGVATWGNAESLNGGVKTEVIRNTVFGTNDNIFLWRHPEGVSGIEVSFHTGAEQVVVTNKTGAIGEWDITIIGGGESANTVKTDDEYIFKFIDDTESAYLDLDTAPANDRGWFKIIASNRSGELDGFIMYIIYKGDRLNGIVQFWDN